MKLHVGERVELLKLLPMPKEADYMTFKILIDLRSALSFTEKEFKDFKIIQKDGKISWEKSTPKEIKIGDVVIEMIQESLKKLNEIKKLNEYSFSLYEKFVETKK
jgi:hypothetical protein